ncbi:MAG: hypothetical protein QW227_02110 [Candidatus Aenigmatarchaeota archaeon]
MFTYLRNKGIAKTGAMALAALIVLAFAIWAVQVIALSVLVDITLNTTILHRTEAISIAARWDATPNASWVEWENATGQGASKIICIWPGNPCPSHNWTNTTLSGGNTTNTGTHGIVIKVNDSTGQIYETSPASFTVWGWSNITNSTALNGTFFRGSIINTTCRVLDKNSSTGIANYSVTFWKNSSSVSYLTNSTGHATWNWDTSTDSIGDYRIACNITDNATLYYTALPSESSLSGIITLTWRGANITGMLVSPSVPINTPANMSCRVLDNSTGSPIEGYMVKFYSNVTGLLDSALTNSTGWANVHYSWSTAGIHNITCNITDDPSKNYVASDKNSSSSILVVYGTLGVSSISEAPSSAHVGQTGIPMLLLNFSAAGENITIDQIDVKLTGSATDGNISSVELWNDTNGLPDQQLASATFSGGSATLIPSTTVTIPASGSKLFHILYNLSASALNSATFGVNISNNSNITATGVSSGLGIIPIGPAPYNSSLTKIWGWANITNATAIAANYQRGTIVNFTCLVQNVNTSEGIANYSVYFWRNNTLLGSNITNSTGHANWAWNTTTEAVGPHNLTCNITYNNTLYFNITNGNSTTLNTSLNGTLVFSFAVAYPDSIYRNDTYSPYETTFRARVNDELGIPVYGVNISFWNDSFSPALLRNCTTDAIYGPGQCDAAPWNPPNTTAPGNYSILVNASGAYYTSSTQNITYLAIKGVLFLNVTNSTGQVISSGTRYYKTQNLTANLTGSDENGNNIPIAGANVTWFLNATNLTNVTPPIANLTPFWDNVTWYINDSWSPLGNWLLNVSVDKGFYNNSPLQLPIQIWGWSHVNESAFPSGVPVNSSVVLACRVRDKNTSAPLSSHTVNFWSNVTGYLGNNYTVSDGWANLTWQTPPNATIHNISCNISENPAQYYTPATGLSGVVHVHGVLTAAVTNEAPYSSARGTSVGMLRLNLSAIGENITLNNISVVLFGTADSTNVSAVELWNDTSGTPYAPIPGASDTSPPFVLSPTSYVIPAGTSRLVHVVYNFSSLAMPYKTLGANITANSSIVGTGVNSFYTFNSTGIGPWTSTETFIQQLPSPVLLGPPDGTVTSNTTVNFTWTSVTGATNYTIYIDNNTNVLSPEYNNTWTDLNYTWSTAAEGIWYWKVSSVDSGGGQTDSAIWKLTVDRSEPYINLTTPANNSNWTSPVQLIYTALDSYSPILNCYYTLDNVPGSTMNIVNGTTQILQLSIEDGAHNISVNCTDQAGNNNVSVTNSFTVDSSGALISAVNLDRSPPYYRGGQNITVNVTASDPSGVTSVTANGVSMTYTAGFWIGNITASSAEGIHEIVIVAKDAANNTNTTSVYYFTDNTPPNITNITVRYPTGKLHVGYYENITITVKVSDLLSGGVAAGINASSVWANLTNTTVSPNIIVTLPLTLTDPVNGIWSGTWNCSSQLNLTNVTINITASDNAMNAVSNADSSFIVDNSGFAITATSVVADKTTANATGSDYWQWTFNLTLASGTRIRARMANWTDGSGHIIPVAGYARLHYQNSTGSWNVYNITEDYNETQTVDPLNITNGWTIVILNQTIPYGTWPATYTTSYAFGIYP